MTKFENAVAIVTGGGHGIGLATAQRLADDGAAVAVFDIARADEAAAALGGGARGHAVDVTDAEAVARAVAAVEADLGPVTVLVNSAGFLRAGDALTTGWDQWRQTFAVNVDGILATVKAVLPGMVERGAGAVVNVASIGGLRGLPGLTAYNASKGAVVNLTRQLAVEHRAAGVRVNAVCPGMVPTGFNDPMFAGVPDEEIEAFVQAKVPAGRQADPAEIAAAIAFLASDDASYVCGHALVVDGGVAAGI